MWADITSALWDWDKKIIDLMVIKKKLVLRYFSTNHVKFADQKLQPGNNLVHIWQPSAEKSLIYLAFISLVDHVNQSVKAEWNTENDCCSLHCPKSPLCSAQPQPQTQLPPHPSTPIK